MYTETNQPQIGIPLFDGTNWNNWIFRMETLLDEKGLSQFIQKDVASIIEQLTDKIEEAKKNEKKNAKRLSFVVLMIANWK